MTDLQATLDAIDRVLADCAADALPPLDLTPPAQDDPVPKHGLFVRWLRRWT